jgi:thiamine kinase-like enzyme
MSALQPASSQASLVNLILQSADAVELVGGITNHNYRVDLDGQTYVLRIAGERTELLGIDRQAEYACAVAAMEAGVGVAVIGFVPERNALITRLAPGRPLTPQDLQSPDVLDRITRALRAFHAIAFVPGSFSPFEVVRGYHQLALSRGVAFPGEMKRALQVLGEIENAVRSDDPSCPCHNDLLPSNLLDDGDRVRIIDWEYAGMGDRFFDLGNFAVNNQLAAEAEEKLLRSYFGAVDPEHLRRLRLMRLASDMRESLWGYLQSAISALDFDFLGYGREHLDRFLSNASSMSEDLAGTAPR